MLDAAIRSKSCAAVTVSIVYGRWSTTAQGLVIYL
jgi:hypothetical protein